MSMHNEEGRRGEIPLSVFHYLCEIKGANIYYRRMNSAGTYNKHLFQKVSSFVFLLNATLSIFNPSLSNPDLTAESLRRVVIVCHSCVKCIKESLSLTCNFYQLWNSGECLALGFVVLFKIHVKEKKMAVDASYCGAVRRKQFLSKFINCVVWAWSLKRVS